VAEQQKLYLSLPRLGKTEIEINAVEDMPCWDTRFRRLSDKDFSARRLEAQEQGCKLGLVSAEEKLEDTYQRAITDAASPQLVTITDKIAQYVRWKASKLNRDLYGEKIQSDNRNTNVNARVDAQGLAEAPDDLVAELHAVLARRSAKG